jgi:hypothetical protein
MAGSTTLHLTVEQAGRYRQGQFYGRCGYVDPLMTRYSDPRRLRFL